MSDLKNGNGKDDAFLTDLEEGIRLIIKGKKVSKADKIAAINAGVRLAGIKHKISSGETDEGFFGK